MARTTTYTQVLALPAADIWRVLGDPERLPEWNPAVSSVVMHGPVAAGATGDIVPRGRLLGPVHQRTANPFVLSTVTPERELTLEQDTPMGRMYLTWTLTPVAGGTELAQRLTFTGPSAGAIRAIIGNLVETDARVCFARLAILFTQREWDGRTVGDWADALVNPGPTAVVNLAGKLVDCRPTPENIDELRRSRVEPTRALVAATAGLDRPIDYWIQASTTAIWSDAGETRCTETTALPTGPAALPQMTGVAAAWEEAFDGAKATHSMVLRTSIVLDPQAPALKRLCQLTRAGLGGRIGDGKQWFSWIHIEDWLAIVRAALGLDPEVRLPDGILVAATDFPVRNRDLMTTLRRHLHRPPAPPTPKPLLALGAIALRSDPALGLTGRHATSAVLRETGFRFRYPTLDDALSDLLPS
ncbi:DUF1731 domain-containing protein [Nocardia cyriacigeorgica]|jgi:uncharacterized protein|uniref:DUF1731 domain-containing protein n=1 Tax=Nocardia cyriacigeorgica TaxID=135487 RepID=UPI0002E04696|nr:DUF1731 domain-containing protein [Nocardia cyriacigeorgica]AVH22159.1 DUF1731 domain-containing protein [Nocardia cyriacigeorgica]PPJ05267.1 DUF1731 domain-containing protein [Nocardia cyriacigeorgica]TLF59538.1 DUF1731 domain-containing protein [Nocardia cyriacigeorgica]